MYKAIFLFLLISTFFISSGEIRINRNHSVESIFLKAILKNIEYKTENNEIIRGLPEIGKWMLDPDYTPSKWSDDKLYNKEIWEPINIVIADSFSNSESESMQNLVDALDKTGYKNRWGHSTGYMGLIDSIFCKQCPENSYCAISNLPFIFNNNHGRIFGPYYKNGVYYFTGAMSRESGYYHKYISFTEARDDLGSSLNTKTNYKLTKKIWLDNILANDSLTTGDHDGYAIFLEAIK